MNIESVSPRENGVLFVVAEDGRRGIMDVRPYFEFPAFNALKNEGQFNKVRNGRYFVEWACGADLSADTIEARWVSMDDETA